MQDAREERLEKLFGLAADGQDPNKLPVLVLQNSNLTKERERYSTNMNSAGLRMLESVK
jgi:hypothetical protein